MSLSTDRPVRPPPRTQAERREATRTALLDATIECLIDHGYANTTTSRVADLAGVSRGAQIHYFENKAALVAAAIDHLAHRRIAQFQTRLHDIPTGPERVQAMLDILWEAHQGEIFDATLEVWVAARTDPDLHAGLITLERGVGQSIWTLASELLGDRPTIRADVEFALATVRGLALLRIASGENPRTFNKHWPAARERLLRLLLQP